MWKFLFWNCVTKCATINQKAELENARFLIFFSSHFFSNSTRRPPTVKSPRILPTFVTFLLFLFKVAFLPPSYLQCFIEATCSPDLHSINISRSPHSGIERQTKKRTKRCIKMRLLIVKISVIFHLYQKMLSQCQFLSTFSVLNRFAKPMLKQN